MNCATCPAHLGAFRQSLPRTALNLFDLKAAEQYYTPNPADTDREPAVISFVAAGLGVTLLPGTNQKASLIQMQRGFPFSPTPARTTPKPPNLWRPLSHCT
jgi:hypothetical protein